MSIQTDRFHEFVDQQVIGTRETGRAIILFAIARAGQIVSHGWRSPSESKLLPDDLREHLGLPEDTTADSVAGNQEPTS